MESLKLVNDQTDSEPLDQLVGPPVNAPLSSTHSRKRNVRQIIFCWITKSLLWCWIKVIWINKSYWRRSIRHLGLWTWWRGRKIKQRLIRAIRRWERESWMPSQHILKLNSPKVQGNWRKSRLISSRTLTGMRGMYISWVQNRGIRHLRYRVPIHRYLGRNSRGIWLDHHHKCNLWEQQLIACLKQDRLYQHLWLT